MILKENLPRSVDKTFKEISSDGEIQIAITGDIAGNGGFGEQWLIVTKRKLFVFSPNENKATLEKKISLTELNEVKTQPLVGSSALEAIKKNGSLIEILRYSNIHSTKFAAAAKWINQLTKKEELSPITDEGPFRCPNCGLILKKGTKVCPRCVQRRKVFIRLMAYLKPYLLLSVAIVALALASTSIRLVPPYLTKILIDDVLGSDHYGLLVLIILTLAGLSLVGTALRIFRGRATAWLGSKITYDIRGQLYEKIQSMSMQFFDKHKIGALMSRVNRDTRALQEFLAFEMPFFAVNLLLLVGIGVVLLWMNWKLALFTLIPAPLVALGTTAIRGRIKITFRRVWHRWAQLSAVLNDTLSGIRVVKGFAQEQKEVERFSKKSYSLFQANMQAEQTWATFLPMFSFLWGTGSLIVWYFGGRDVMGGEITLGTLMAFLAYLGIFYGPLEMVTRAWNWITRSFAAAERIFEILDMESEVPDFAEAVPINRIKGAVEFNNVTFGYDKHLPVLHNINLNVTPGEMIGFVGKSGAGKTTMTNLICRFYTADEGNILIDGLDIKEVALSDLRRQIGVVLQEPFLFNGSISENIGYAKPGATLEEIIQAARIANAHDFIVKFPDGYDTNVGERGQKLSGGERQRVSIARAVLRDPRILILDEATSLVDTETERNIQEALARLVKGRTTFAIAHRLSTLRNADRLVVLDEGKCVEMGTHNELMKKQGTYYKLVELQSEMSKIHAVGVG